MCMYIQKNGFAFLSWGLLTVTVFNLFGGGTGQLGEKVLIATRNGKINDVQTLIKSGANINEQDAQGFTPLHIAVELFNLEMVQMLVANKANVDAKDRLGWSPLHMACTQGAAQIIDVLIKAGANLNEQNPAGRTPLHMAALRGRYEIVQALIKAGAQGNIVDSYGQTPLQIAENALKKYDADAKKEDSAWLMNISSQEKDENKRLAAGIDIKEINNVKNSLFNTEKEFALKIEQLIQKQLLDPKEYSRLAKKFDLDQPPKTAVTASSKLAHRIRAMNEILETSERGLYLNTIKALKAMKNKR